MSSSYTQIAQLKSELRELIPHARPISREAGMPEDLDVGVDADSTIGMIVHPILKQPRVFDFTRFFINRAFDHSGEYGLKRLQWYFGVTCGNPLVAYLHHDGHVDLRVTSSATSSENEISSSTRLTIPDFDFATHFPDYDPAARDNQVPFDDIPTHLLEPPTPEGTITLLTKHRYHVEQPLTDGVAKLFFAADIKFE